MAEKTQPLHVLQSTHKLIAAEAKRSGRTLGAENDYLVRYTLARKAALRKDRERNKKAAKKVTKKTTSKPKKAAKPKKPRVSKLKPKAAKTQVARLGEVMDALDARATDHMVAPVLPLPPAA